MKDNNSLFQKKPNEYENKNNIYIGGYDEDLVINKNYLLSLDTIYKCNICYKIMINPVECEKCGYNFCYNCINSSDCPFGCKETKIKESSLAVKNLLSFLRFKCPNKGCTVSFEYSKIEAHNEECPFKLIKCPNRNCEKLFLRKDISNHVNNECEYLMIKCKYCNYEFLKREIEHHENICKLLNTQKDSLNYDMNKIGVDEHLKRLSKNLNEIIKNNQKLVENSENYSERNEPNNNDKSNYRFSIRKSIVPGLEGDEFLDTINKEIETKIKNYYNDFSNNFIKIIKEIDDIKEILKHYINNIIIDNNFNNKNTNKLNNNKDNNIIEQEKRNKKKENEENKKFLTELIDKLDSNLKILIKNYNKKFSNECSSINNILFGDKDNDASKNINDKEKININKDMYSIINNIVKKLKEYILETNNQIKNLKNNINSNLNNIINDKKTKSDIITNQSENILDISIGNDIQKLYKELEEIIKKNYTNFIHIEKNVQKKQDNKNDKNHNKENDNEKNEINKENFKKEINSLNSQIENVNDSLNNIKKNIKQTINTINESFTDFSEYIRKNSKKINKEKAKNISYKICQITSFSLFEQNLKNNKDNNIYSFNSDEFVNIFNPSIILKNLESRMSSLETNTKDFSLKLKEKVKSQLFQKLSEINTHIENDIDEKIEKIFSLKYCQECEKIDYFYGFFKCNLCNRENCKQCIVICINCKNFCCVKCCLCKKCDKLICEKCRTLCICCNIKYCQFCILTCSLCKNNTCSNCIFQCSFCNKNICKINCCKTCSICYNNLCKNCEESIEFSKCCICNNIICEKCFNKCKEHDKIICQKCLDKCNICQNTFCNKFIIECNDCKNKYCLKCGKNYEENNSCKICKNAYCIKCSINHQNIKCIECLNKVCNKCSSKCINCSKSICKECSNLCDSCNNFSCNKCLSECICGMKKFCNKCLLKKETLIPHNCVYFINDSSMNEAKKTRSINKISNKSNIEAKLVVYMDDISDESFLLVGITDNDKFEENDKNEIKNVFAVNVNNGDKFCSEKGFEAFLDFDYINKGFNDVYIMIKEHKLFFKINDSIYKWAYELKNSGNYWFYLENNIYKSSSKFVFVRKIK